MRGGGCSGFQYALAFDTQRDGDEVFEDHGLRILVDGPSLPYVERRGRRLRRGPPGRRLQGRQPERDRGLRLRLLLPRRGGGRGLRRLSRRSRRRRRARRVARAAGRLRRRRAPSRRAAAPRPPRPPTPRRAEGPLPRRPRRRCEDPRPAARRRHHRAEPELLLRASPDVPQPFARWRDALGKMHPALYRLVIYWPSIQPSAARPPTSTRLNGGCLRDKPPCAAYAGVRDQLQALAARQKRGRLGGLVVITGTPEWAARPAVGLRARRHGPRATGCRAPTRCRPTGSSSSDMLARGRAGGRDAALLGAVERAQPPVLLLAAARRAVRRGAAERLGRSRTSRSRARCRRALRQGARRPALRDRRGRRSWSAGCRSPPPSTSSSTRCPPSSSCGAARVDAAHLHRRRGRARRRRRAAEAPRAAATCRSG